MARTVRDVTFDLLRRLGITTVVGNPGSTEETFLQNFPADFTYVLALQEASVVGIADGLAQGLRRPVLVNVHTGAGLGNAMGCVLTAYQNRTPLILTAGQQTREMLMLEPLLTNIDAVVMPRPWVKWSYEPPRAEDVPAAFMRAYAIALQPPAGPVFLSLPLDDWSRPMGGMPELRSVSTRIGPDPQRVETLVDAIAAARAPVLVYGAEIARAGAWDAGVQVAERLGCPVWTAPFCERTPFPETHRQHAGVLPAAIGPLAERLQGHDVMLVVGAPVFRYYPFVAGRHLPDGTRLWQVTEDPDLAAKAPVGHALLADAGLFLDALLPRLPSRSPAAGPHRAPPPPPAPEVPGTPLDPDQVFAILAAAVPSDVVLVEESPSNVAALQRRMPIDRPDSFYTFASGGLGWGLPAAVGHALAERQSGRNRPVIAVMGDGSFQYSVQSLYTAVQQKLHLVVLVLANEEYAILKEFAVLEETPNVPGLDLPGLDIVSLGRGYGADAVTASTVAEIAAAFAAALARNGTSLIVVPIAKGLRPLLG